MAKSSEQCPVCSKPAKLKAGATEDHIEIDCRQCGTFGVSASFLQPFRDIPEFAKRLSLEHAQNRARYGAIPIITNYDVP